MARQLVVGLVLLAGGFGWPGVAEAGLREAVEAYRNRDFAAAMAACRPAADAGDAACENFVGELFDGGDGIAANPIEAVRWFRLSAGQGNGFAAINLGMAYATGRGVPKDLDQAESWLRRAAGQGLPEAELQLGLFLFEHRGDAKQSVKWYRSAAAQGLPAAQFALGLVYELGNGVRRNGRLAVKWYARAADHGLAGAQSRLAGLYERGEGGESDPREAYFWYAVAAAAPDNPDRKTDEASLRRIAATLSEAARKEASAAAANWHPQPIEIRTTPRTGRKSASRERTGPGRRLYATGSGFYVSRAGHVLTNEHVVAECREMRVTEGSNGVPATVLATDARRDLALLQMPHEVAAAALFRDAQKARLGESVMVVGFPLQGLITSGPVVTTGIVSALAGPQNDRRLLQISAPVQPGNSGGPLLDGGGRIIGIVKSELDGARVARLTGAIPQNVNFAVSAEEARQFLAEHHVAVQSAPGGGELATAAVADLALAVTVRLECWE